MNGEKKIESITFKCTDGEKSKLEAIARVRKLSLSELIRSICIGEIQVVESYLNSLSKEFSLATDTADTFHLEPVVMPKKINGQAQKKPNCCDQLSLIGHSFETQTNDKD